MIATSRPDSAPPKRSSSASKILSRRRQLRDHVMRHLPKLDRLIIVLYYYEQLTAYEVAMVLNLTEVQVETRRVALADRLRAMLQ